MKLKLLEKKKDRITFEIGKSPQVGYVNTLRRVFMHEVPIMAVSKVEFKQNTSALYDEIIAHRLGMLALKTDLKSYNIPKKGDEESAATHLKMTLKATGPKTVYASDIKSKDPKVVPVHPETPIVKLLEGQEIELVATAHLGYGKDHSKWNTGLAHYYFKPRITVNNKSSKLKDFIDKYPPQVRKKDIIDKDKILSAPELIDACADINDDVVKIEYDEKPEEIIFRIESWGQLTPDQIVNEGIKQYDSQLDELKKLAKDI